MWVIFVLYFVCGGMSLGWASSADPLPPLSHNAVEALGQLTHHLQNPNAADKEQAAQLIASMVYTGVGEKDHNYGFREKAAAADIDAVKRALEALGTAMTRFPDLEKYIYGQRGKAPRDLPKTHIETCTIFIHEALIKALETKMGKSGSIIGSEKDKILSQMITARQKSLASQINILLDTSFRKVDQLIGQQSDPVLVKKLKQAQNIGLFSSFPAKLGEKDLTEDQWKVLTDTIIQINTLDESIRKQEAESLKIAVDTLITQQTDPQVQAQVRAANASGLLTSLVDTQKNLSKDEWRHFIKAIEEAMVLNEDALRQDPDTKDANAKFIKSIVDLIDGKKEAVQDKMYDTILRAVEKKALWSIPQVLIVLIEQKQGLSETQWDAFLDTSYAIIDIYKAETSRDKMNASKQKIKEAKDKLFETLLDEEVKEKTLVMEEGSLPAINALGKDLSSIQFKTFLKALWAIHLINKGTQAQIDKAIENTRNTPPSGVSIQDWEKTMKSERPKNSDVKRSGKAPNG